MAMMGPSFPADWGPGWGSDISLQARGLLKIFKWKNPDGWPRCWGSVRGHEGRGGQKLPRPLLEPGAGRGETIIHRQHRDMETSHWPSYEVLMKLSVLSWSIIDSTSVHSKTWRVCLCSVPCPAHVVPLPPASHPTGPRPCPAIVP